MSKRIYVFIDGSNFYHNLVKLIGYSHFGDYKAFIQSLLMKGCKLADVTYYVGRINPNTGSTRSEKARSRVLFERQAKFLDWLKKSGINYKLGYFQKNGNIEKGVDVKIAVDMIKLAYEDKYDIAFLISGDGDLVDGVKMAQEIGKRVYNLIFRSNNRFSYRLRAACDQYFYLDNQLRAFIKNNN